MQLRGFNKLVKENLKKNFISETQLLNKHLNFIAYTKTVVP